MARPKISPSQPTISKSESKSTPQKRTFSPQNSTPPTRQSKRNKSTPIAKTTPQKSQYFQHDSGLSEPESVIENEASGYEDEDASVTAGSDLEEDETLISSDDDFVASRATKKRKRKSGGKDTNNKKNNHRLDPTKQVGVGGKGSTKGKGQELWRPGVKTGLAPGEELFIKLPKPREAGDRPYRDDTVHPNTMIFLGELRENNDREWLKVHDADYRQSQKDFNSFVECLTEKIIEKDATIPELPSKDLTFRIYRDVRFSSDPTPYKTHYSAAWSRTGRKGPYAAYYVQIKPSGSFVGAGLWQPEAAPLALMRQAIDGNSRVLKSILLQPAMRKEFLKGVSAGDEGKAVKAFVAMNTENMLKTKPKGYEANNPNIPLLRLRNYTIGRSLTDEEVLASDAATRIADLIGVLTPFVTYLNSVVMPDPEEESSEDENEDENDEGEGEEEEEEEEEEE